MLKINCIFIPIIFTISAALSVWGLLNLLIKNKYKSSIITSIFFILFFSYGHLIELVGNYIQHSIGINADLYVSVNLILIFTIISYLVLKFLKKYLVINSLLNFVAIGLLAYPVFAIAQSELIKTDGQNNESEPKVKENIFTIPDNVEKPDIYYIILDGYGRDDVLKSVYGYDNNSFLNELEDRNFFIAGKSRANYAQTLLSLSSTLNMNYLEPSRDDTVDMNIYRHNLSSEIIHSSVTSILKKIGYHIVTFASGYSGTEIKNSDLYVKPDYLFDEFQFMLVRITPLYKLFETLHNKLPIYLNRQRIVSAIQKIPDIKTQGAPMFLFAHIVAPHPPFVLSNNEKSVELQKKRILSYADGSHYHSFDKSLMEEYKKNYISQLKEINKLIIKMVDKILVNMDRETIIILQSDHGPGLLLNWENPTVNTFTERLPILNAYFFPNDKKIPVTESISPVNTFRIIFNYYFNCKYEILDNKSYFSTWSKPYRFINVDQYF